MPPIFAIGCDKPGTHPHPGAADRGTNGTQCRVHAPRDTLSEHGRRTHHGIERRPLNPVVDIGGSAHHDGHLTLGGVRRVVGGAEGGASERGDGGQVLDSRAPGHDSDAARAGEPGLELGEALPEVPAADAVRREEEEQDRGGRPHDFDRDPSTARVDALDVEGRPAPPVGRDRSEPAHDVRRRLGHVAADAAPGSTTSSSRSSTTPRPWPHQRQTTSSTWRRSTTSSSIRSSPPTVK